MRFTYAQAKYKESTGLRPPEDSYGQAAWRYEWYGAEEAKAKVRGFAEEILPGAGNWLPLRPALALFLELNQFDERGGLDIAQGVKRCFAWRCIQADE